MELTKSFQLSNEQGVEIEFLSLGAKIKSIYIPDKKGKTDIALGFDTKEEYETGDIYLGAICGRVANRIGMGQFELDGKKIKLAQNDRTNHLHGGIKGFNTKQWQVEPINLNGYSSAYKLSLISPDGDENYPGNLEVNIIYALSNQNEFLIDLQAQTDKTTVVNLTSHPYFNLNGVGKGKVFNHFLEINADAFTPLNDVSVPTGEIKNVEDTDMDFRKPVKLGDVINSEYQQIKLVGGLDHNWVLNKKENEMVKAAVVSEPESGRAIEVYTTQPGLQVYTAMHFDGSETGKGQIPLSHYCAIALEAQNFPDAPNKPNFPSAVLKPDEKYHQQIMYKFIF